MEDLEKELSELATRLEDTDPSAAFSLREGACYFTEIPFRVPLHLPTGGVRLTEVFKTYHGTPKGRFLLSLSATPSPNLRAMRATSLERTLRACLHNLQWNGADLQVSCDTRSLSPELRAQLRRQVHAEIARRRGEDLLEFVLPWRRLASEHRPQSDNAKAPHPETMESTAAAHKIDISSAVDLYEHALLSIYPTICASRGLRIDDCVTMIRGRGSWAFRIAEAIQHSFSSPVRVELGGRRYRPAPSRPRPSNIPRPHAQQGRWETDEKEASSQTEVLILLGGGDTITADRASEIRASVVFHLHRDSLTAQGDRLLRERGILVIPHLLLSSAEELAAASLSKPEILQSILSADEQSLKSISQNLRASWRGSLLTAWERILAKSRDEQCSPHSASVRLAAQTLVEMLRTRLGTPGLPTSKRDHDSEAPCEEGHPDPPQA
jgi:hypothetical protein